MSLYLFMLLLPGPVKNRKEIFQSPAPRALFSSNPRCGVPTRKTCLWTLLEGQRHHSKGTLGSYPFHAPESPRQTGESTVLDSGH